MDPTKSSSSDCWPSRFRRLRGVCAEASCSPKKMQVSPKNNCIFLHCMSSSNSQEQMIPVEATPPHPRSARSCTWQLASVTLKMKQVKPLVKAAMRLFPQPNESRPGHEHTSAHQMSIAGTRAATFILSACHPCSNVHISVAATSTGYRGVLTNETHCDLVSCDK
jgi:hypothetical protein